MDSVLPTAALGNPCAVSSEGSSKGSLRATLAALAANAGIAVAKFVAYFITGSSSMLGEAVHSVADTSNQGLLLIGQRKARKDADNLHPFGHGRSRYFYSFVVALVLFTLGAVFAWYEGYEKIAHREQVTSPVVAFSVLAVAFVLEAYSFRTARRESRPLKGANSWWGFIRSSRNPELPVVLLEDSGALVGLALAFAGVGLTVLTENPVWDGIATIGIGCLLGWIAVVLIVETHSLLIGEGATRDQERAIRSALSDGDALSGASELRTQYLGPDELLVVARVVVSPGLSAGRLTEVINDAEDRVRSAIPAARMIYIEPELATR
jgi:cation diffusion facilitator family transporter